MKKPYEEPKIIIEFFLGQDIVTFSGGSNPGGEDDWGDEPIGGGGDA